MRKVSQKALLHEIIRQFKKLRCMPKNKRKQTADQLSQQNI